jgi:hypothetical protein
VLCFKPDETDLRVCDELKAGATSSQLVAGAGSSVAASSVSVQLVTTVQRLAAAAGSLKQCRCATSDDADGVLCCDGADVGFVIQVGYKRVRASQLNTGLAR